MAVPATDALLTDLDHGTHRARVGRLARLGRDERGTPQLSGLLDELTGLGGYWHELALVAAVAARDGERVLAGLSSPAAGVRGFAWSHLITAGVDVDAVVGAAVGASAVDRRRLVGVVCRSGRHDVAEELLVKLRTHYGDREAARLLPACTDATVVELLPELDYAVANWQTLARRHPVPVVHHLEALLRAAPRSQRDQLWRTVGPGAAVAVETLPEEVLVLLEDLGPSWGPAPVLGRALGRLIRAFPSRVVALLLRPAHRASLARRFPLALLTNAGVLPEPDRVEVARAVRDNPAVFAGFLRRFAPSQRGPLFRATYADVDTSRRSWTFEILEHLPHAVRTVEATRELTLREVADDPVRTLRVTSFLPIAVARPALDQALNAAKAEDRAVAYGLLVACTRRSRSSAELGATLERLRRLKNEQDPVRLAAVVELARTPPRLFDETHLPALGDLVTTVVEARDSSHATIGNLRALMLRLLALRPAPSPVFDFALAGLDQLAGPSGTVAFGRLTLTLPRGAERSLLAALLPRLRREADRDRFDLTLSLTSALGRRAWELDDLQALLARATWAPLDSTVRRGVELWLAPPRTRDDRVGQVVAADPSTLTLPSVLRAVTTSRQDLLDILFQPSPARSTRRFRALRPAADHLKGRFLSGDVRYVPVITTGLGRWLPRQHRAYADALRDLIRDPATKPWTVASALGAVARLPLIGASELASYETDDDDVARSEAILAGLAWTDSPDLHLTRLLGFADSDRARVAVYAAGRCARFTRPDALGRALDTVLDAPTTKVTARKEAVRLLAQHRPPGALERLLRVADSPGAHRDVRIAVGRSLRGFLDDERAWDILSSLADTGPGADEARSVLDTIPANIATRHRARFATLVARVAEHPDPIARRQACALLAMWSPWSAEAAGVAARHVADFGSGPSWPQATASLVAIYGDGRATEETNGLIAQLIAAAVDTDAALDAGADRDRPARQRLGAIVNGLITLPIDQRARLRSALVAAVDLLAADPTMVGWQIGLRLGATDLSRPTDALLGIDDLVVARPAAAMVAANGLRTALTRNEATWRPDDLVGAFDALSARESLTASLLAVALLSAAGPRAGWSEPWRARLRALRASPDADVATAALGIITASE